MQDRCVGSVIGKAGVALSAMLCAAAAAPRLPTRIANADAAVPGGWRQEIAARGDLNKDGRPDLALVLRQADPHLLRTDEDGRTFNDNPRVLAVYFAQATGGYRLVAEDGRLIPTGAQRDYDPLTGIARGGVTIARGTLQVSLGRFASSVTSDTFTFRWQKKHFVLIGYDSDSVGRTTNTEVTNSFSYLTARRKRSVERVSDDDTHVTWSDLPRHRLEALGEIGNGLDFDPLAPPPIPPAAWNWADAPHEGYSDDPALNATQKICSRLRHLQPPAADIPGSGGGAPDGRCSSSALYYGIGEKADPAKARACAFYEIGRPDLGDDPFAGIGMLMTIYANGRGAKRNLDLATALACRVPGAPAELDGRIKHLQSMKRALAGDAERAAGCAASEGTVALCGGMGADVLAGGITAKEFADKAVGSLQAKPVSVPPFDYCDDITSGFAGEQCAARDADIADAKRDARIAAMISGWEKGARAAFVPLRKAAEAYAQVSADNEVDMSGTARGMFAIERREAVLDAFVATLAKAEAGTLPLADKSNALAADSALNAIYRRIMALHIDPADVAGYQSADSLPSTTVTHEGIRKAERAWLAYRDAWLVFAKRDLSRRSAARLSVVLTRERIEDLTQFAKQN